MTLNRRDFVLNTAALAGGSLVSAWPGRASAKLLTSGTGVEPDIKPTLLADAQSRETRLGLDRRLWNWRKEAPANGAMPANYYEASLSPWKNFASLTADQSADVVVIGGGLLGVSTALHLAEAGVDVILVEKDNIGSAASGRNGGQLTPGLARWEAGTMQEHLSHEDAKRLWRFGGVEAMACIDRIVAEYGLDVDRKKGHLTAAVHPGHMSAFVEDADARKVLGDNSVKVVGAHEVKEFVNSTIYYGGAVDALGGQLHPLALLRGMVYGLQKGGGRIFEGTEVTAVDESKASTVVVTTRGKIVARLGVVVAVHNSAFKFMSGSPTTVPFFTYVSVTPPLKQDIKTLIPSDLPVYDTQVQIDYYRSVKGNRLLFGGQGTGNSWSPRDVNQYLLGRIKTVFPQLESPEIDYSWGGISDLTLNGATDSRKSASNVPVYMVHGWSGHGVAQTVRIGKAISDDVTGRNDDFLMLTKIDHQAIPLGRQLSPIAIPVIKGALAVMGAVRPDMLFSF